MAIDFRKTQARIDSIERMLKKARNAERWNEATDLKLRLNNERVVLARLIRLAHA